MIIAMEKNKDSGLRVLVGKSRLDHAFGIAVFIDGLGGPNRDYNIPAKEGRNEPCECQEEGYKEQQDQVPSWGGDSNNSNFQEECGWSRVREGKVVRQSRWIKMQF